MPRRGPEAGSPHKITRFNDFYRSGANSRSCPLLLIRNFNAIRIRALFLLSHFAAGCAVIVDCSNEIGREIPDVSPGDYLTQHANTTVRKFQQMLKNWKQMALMQAYATILPRMKAQVHRNNHHRCIYKHLSPRIPGNHHKLI